MPLVETHAPVSSRKDRVYCQFKETSERKTLIAVAVMADQSNRPHRTGKEKKAHSGGPNPKAFAYNAPGRLAKQGARSQDVWALSALLLTSY